MGRVEDVGIAVDACFTEAEFSEATSDTDDVVGKVGYHRV